MGGCILGAINKLNLRNVLSIPVRYDIVLVIALGKPKEKVVVEMLQTEGSVKYWRDGEGVHHVPKRALDDIILPL